MHEKGRNRKGKKSQEEDEDELFDPESASIPDFEMTSHAKTDGYADFVSTPINIPIIPPADSHISSDTTNGHSSLRRMTKHLVRLRCVTISGHRCTDLFVLIRSDGSAHVGKRASDDPEISDIQKRCACVLGLMHDSMAGSNECHLSLAWHTCLVPACVLSRALSADAGGTLKGATGERNPSRFAPTSEDEESTGTETDPFKPGARDISSERGEGQGGKASENVSSGSDDEDKDKGKDGDVGSDGMEIDQTNPHGSQCMSPPLGI